MNASDQTTLAGSLPTPLTSLIGREREIAEVADLLCRADVRLVTLTGPGGVGKTRLAIEAVHAVASSFSDGAWFVDLAPARDPDQVIPAIAAVLGMSSRSGSVQALLATLGPETNTLLLLDNFEHVVDAAPSVADLLKGARGLTILVTSREPLKVGGEREYPIAPLPLPNTTAELAPEQLADLDSVRLFAERAQAVSPAFTLTPDNAAAVAEICRRLDGLPLAIELAAARVKALPVPALRDRLEQRLPMLVGDRRDAPERQQTMRSAIAWSYALLPPNEQMLFRRLGVFVGGFTLEAAEAIGAVGNAGFDALRILSSLVDKSLVRLEDAALGGPRYRMLETIHEFAREHLQSSDEYDAVRNTHAAWFSRLAEERQMHGDVWHEPTSSGHVVPPVEVDYGNVRAAMAWLDESGNYTELARMAGSVYWYWAVHGPRRDGVTLLRKAWQAESDTPRDKQSRIWAMEGLAHLERNAGHLDEATRAALEIRALAQELGDEFAESSALGWLGVIAVAQGDYDRADALGRQAIAKRQQFSTGWPVSHVWEYLGQAAYGKGDLGSARALFEDALAAGRQRSDPFETALVLGHLALLECQEDAYRDAAAQLTEALPIWRDLNNQENIAEWLADVAVLANAIGNFETSVRVLAAAIALRDAVGHAFVLPERAIYEFTEQSLRDALSPDAYARAYRAGSDQPLDKTLDEASAFLTRVQAVDDATQQPRATDSLGLTPRELDVLRLLAAGRTDREIAEALYIGTRTVETHVSNLIAKLGARNRAEAAVIATREGIASP